MKLSRMSRNVGQNALFGIVVGIAILSLSRCEPAHAESVATSQNNLGGDVILTDTVPAKCLNTGGNGMYTTDIDGRITNRGCWFGMDKVVRVDYDDGEKKFYNANEFVFTPYGRKLAAEVAKRKAAESKAQKPAL